MGPKDERMEMSGQYSNQGSPQKSQALHSESSYGGPGSLPPMPAERRMASPYGSLSRREASNEHVPPSPTPVRPQAPQGSTSSQNNGQVGGDAGTALNIEDVRDIVRDEVEKLQDDLEESLRNLHMDMIRQFHQQSQELNSALSSQLAAMDQLREENQRLREENDFLKRHQQQQQQQSQASVQPRKRYENGTIFGN